MAQSVFGLVKLFPSAPVGLGLPQFGTLAGTTEHLDRRAQTHGDNPARPKLVSVAVKLLAFREQQCACPAEPPSTRTSKGWPSSVVALAVSADLERVAVIRAIDLRVVVRPGEREVVQVVDRVAGPTLLVEEV